MVWWSCNDYFWTIFTLGRCGFLKGKGGHERTDFSNFHFGRMWSSWREWFLSFSPWEGVVVLKGLTWTIITLGECDSPERVILDNFHLEMMWWSCKTDFWLIWPMFNSGNVIRLHCCFQHQHHCHLCRTFLVTSLMPVSAYVTYILTSFPHWCMQSNVGIWFIFDIWQSYLLLAHILQYYGL